MNRGTIILFLAAGALMAILPGRAQAQVAVQVQLYWQWSSDGWRPHRSAHAPPRTVYRPGPGGVYHLPPREVVFYSPPRAIRVPPGHLPPPGRCRLWYPGRPPGHQPPPQPCGHLFRSYRSAGAVILGSPAYHEVYGGPSARDDRGRGRREGRGRGRGRGGG